MADQVGSSWVPLPLRVVKSHVLNMILCLGFRVNNYKVLQDVFNKLGVTKVKADRSLLARTILQYSLTYFLLTKFTAH